MHTLTNTHISTLDNDLLTIVKEREGFRSQREECPDGVEIEGLGAQEERWTYEVELIEIMNHFGVFEEAELVGGAVLKFSKYHKNRSASDVRQKVSEAISALRRRTLRYARPQEERNSSIAVFTLSHRRGIEPVTTEFFPTADSAASFVVPRQ